MINAILIAIGSLALPFIWFSIRPDHAIKIGMFFYEQEKEALEERREQLKKLKRRIHGAK